MSDEETLFDVGGYGGPPRRRSRRKPPITEIHLVKPWVLLGHHGHEPVAHLLKHNALPNKDGAWRARCGRLGYRIEIEGRPLARVCRTCLNVGGEG